MAVTATLLGLVPKYAAVLSATAESVSDAFMPPAIIGAQPEAMKPSEQTASSLKREGTFIVNTLKLIKKMTIAGCYLNIRKAICAR